MSEPGHNIHLRSSARTNVGQVRQNNEDNVHLWVGEGAVLAVVADGMGGAAAGEEASRLAVEAIENGMALSALDNEQTLAEVSEGHLSDQLRDSILDANMSIIRRAAEEPEMRGMGTTVTLALVRGKEVIIAHVGDSRAYQITAMDTKIRQITSDHSFVEALFAAGHITREQADEHPMRNVLYRALGQTEEIDVDLYQTYLQVGDRLVLCSDGLTRHVRPSEIADIALNASSPDVASQQLIDLANARGGEDNVSVIVIAVEQSSDYSAADESETRNRPEPNEEDTLVLKERPQILKDAARKNRNHPSDTLNDRLLEAMPTQPSPLLRGKMDAERLSDSRFDDSQEAPGGETLPDRSDSDRPTTRHHGAPNFSLHQNGVIYSGGEYLFLPGKRPGGDGGGA